MGLLDEAIRDHLELKRRRGADPSVVAREEHEALTRAPAGEAPSMDWQGESAAAEEAAERDGGMETTSAREPDYTPRFADDAALAQETAELDMQSELGGAVEHAVDGLEPAMHAGDAPALGSFDAEEIPDEESPERLPEMIPGQERLSLE